MVLTSATAAEVMLASGPTNKIVQAAPRRTGLNWKRSEGFMACRAQSVHPSLRAKTRFKAGNLRRNTGWHRGKVKLLPPGFGRSSGCSNNAVKPRKFILSYASMGRDDSESFRQLFVRVPSRGMIIGHGGNHQFIRACRFDQCEQPTLNCIDAADYEALAVASDAAAINRRVGIGSGLLWRSKRQIFADGAAREMEVGAACDPLGLRIAVSGNRRSRKNA